MYSHFGNSEIFDKQTVGFYNAFKDYDVIQPSFVLGGGFFGSIWRKLIKPVIRTIGKIGKPILRGLAKPLLKEGSKMLKSALPSFASPIIGELEKPVSGLIEKGISAIPGGKMKSTTPTKTKKRVTHQTQKPVLMANKRKTRKQRLKLI